MLPFWRHREREFLLLRLLAEQRLAHTKEKVNLADQLQDTQNSLKTLQDMMGTFKQDFERDIPSFMEQTKWECGIYPIPDSDTEWYFNPSILSQNGQKHLFARKIWQTPHAYLNSVVRFRLDNNIPVEKWPVDIPPQRFSESFEDPRCISDGRGGWWLSVVDFIQKQTFAHQIICKLDSNFRPQQIYHPKIGKNGNSLFTNIGHEKNWLWFWHNDRPHCVYWTFPHTVYRYDWYYGIQEKFETIVEGSLWMTGEPHGGTPPVRVGNEFWTFFHSFTPWKYPRRRYHLGAIAFSARPPFEVTRMTVLPLLSASAQDPVREPLPITIFAGGAIIENDTWHVVFGLNDLKCAWIRIPHDELVELCRPLNLSHGILSMMPKEMPEREPIILDGKEFA